MLNKHTDHFRAIRPKTRFKPCTVKQGTQYFSVNIRLPGFTKYFTPHNK